MRGDTNLFTAELWLMNSGAYSILIHADGPDAHWMTNPLSIAISQRSLGANATLRLALAPGGGQAIRITPAR